MQFKKGDVIGVKWLLNHGHMTQKEIDQLVEEGVLTLLKKYPDCNFPEGTLIPPMSLKFTNPLSFI